MRLFVAVRFEDPVKQVIYNWQELFRHSSFSGNFTAKENYHITIKFLGDTEPEMIKPLCRALRSVAAKAEPFVIEPGRASTFRKGDESLLYLSVDTGKEALWKLADFTEDELAGIGIPREDRPFKSHITLGRRVRFSDEFKFVAEDVGPISFTSNARGLSLMESTREKGRLVYKELYFFPFRRERQ
ncbi:MAG: RNA 2',3'-cyclic phosphodiesterase [Spirochaetia bacterium]|nr:RNA 2',3'-cyclic phosphodiesterase [Spirochaetia bacterium]